MQRVIVYAKPEDYVLVGRVVRKVTDPAYEWSEDRFACVAFQSDGQDICDAPTFSAKRGKSAITIWGPK